MVCLDLLPRTIESEAFVIGFGGSQFMMRCFLALLLFCFVSLHSFGQNHWVSTWASAQMRSEAPSDPLSGGFNDQTVRNVVRVSLGGHTLRVRLSNAFGATLLVIGSVHIAIALKNGSIRRGSDRILTFAGSSSITIPPGAPMMSDPVDLDVPSLTEIAVSIYLPGKTGPPTYHALGMQTSYITKIGDFAGAEEIPNADRTSSWYFLSGIDVLAPSSSSTIVAFGDSITDGLNSTSNENRRWPDVLAERLLANRRYGNVAVVNEGISGNRLLHDTAGPNALARFDRDVLGKSGVKEVILLEGINDLGFPYVKALPFGDQKVTAEMVIAAYRQLIDRAHAHGIKIFGGTLIPYADCGYYSDDGEGKREAINRWIRTSGAFDGVIDFDATIRDSLHPNRMAAVYDSGDHLHPNDAGYKALADSISLGLIVGNN